MAYIDAGAGALTGSTGTWFLSSDEDVEAPGGAVRPADHCRLGLGLGGPSVRAGRAAVVRAGLLRVATRAGPVGGGTAAVPTVPG
ncbi:hypothetical protein QVL82_07960, partial [Cellulosimicrobium funkei]|uniref:hypothetical protein n=1 Tax=Cellulosimicrobium funkei TaxID=264251 RepID=UPI0037581B1A